MFQLKVPNSPTALRLAAEYLGKLAESSQVIRAEQAPTIGDLKYAVSIDTSAAVDALRELETALPPEALELEVATPAPAAVDVYAEAAAEIGGTREEGKAAVLGAQYVEPVAAPLPTATELRDTALLTDSGFTRDQMIAAGWSEESLLQHGYIEAVEVPLVVPAAPGVSAPSAPPVVPAPPAPNTAVELDVNGLPWDARIHAGTKRKNADGSWTAKRGVDDATVASVTAELRGVPTVAVNPTPIVTPPTPTVAPVVAAPPAASGELPATSAEFMQWLSAHIKAGRLSNTDATLAVQSTGLTILPDLMKPENAALIPVVAAKLKADKGL